MGCSIKIHNSSLERSFCVISVRIYHSKLLIFDPLPPPYSPLSILYVIPPPQHMFALVSYPTPSQKRFRDGYKFPNEKSGSEKREKKLKKCVRLFKKETPLYA